MVAKKAKKGDSYVCELCGLAVTVDKVCGCTDECNIMCCGKPMTVKQVKPNTKKK